MNTQTIDHTTLSKLAEAGALHSAQIVGQAGGWGVLVKYGMTECVLAAQRSQKVRIFRKFETLVTYLKGIGIAHFEVDTVNYDAASMKLIRKRPDSSETMKKAHEAAAYDKWFKAEITQAIQEADYPDTQWVTNEDVNKQFASKREALRQRIKAAS